MLSWAASVLACRDVPLLGAHPVQQTLQSGGSAVAENPTPSGCISSQVQVRISDSSPVRSFSSRSQAGGCGAKGELLGLISSLLGVSEGTWLFQYQSPWRGPGPGWRGS